MHILIVITTANREDPDIRLHNAIFYQGLHCLPRQNWSSEKKTTIVFKSCNLLITSIQKEECISAFKVLHITVFNSKVMNYMYIMKHRIW